MTHDKEWRTIARVGELKSGEMRQIYIGDFPIALANVDGTYYAFGDTCPHEEFPLSESELKGCYVSCALHGWTFDIRNGNPRPPLIQSRIPVFEVKVDGDQIKIRV